MNSSDNRQLAVDRNRPVYFSSLVGHALLVIVTAICLYQVYEGTRDSPRTWTTPTEMQLTSATGIFRISRFVKSPGYELRALDGRTIYFSCSPDYLDLMCLANKAISLNNKLVSIAFFYHLNKRPILRLRHSAIVMELVDQGTKVMSYEPRKAELEKLAQFEDEPSDNLLSILIEIMIGSVLTLFTIRFYKALVLFMRG